MLDEPRTTYMVILPAIPFQPKLYIKWLPGYAKGETSGPLIRSDVLSPVFSPHHSRSLPFLHIELRCIFCGAHSYRCVEMPLHLGTTRLSARTIAGANNLWVRAHVFLLFWSRV